MGSDKVMSLITSIKDKIQGKNPSSKKRSEFWPEVRKKHVLSNPTCAVCGGNKKLEVHHIKPFHLAPELELDPNNLITLCENKTYGKLICHLVFGHLGNYKSFNDSIISDSAYWKNKFLNRVLPPKVGKK